MFSWFTDTILPRFSGALISEIYSGAMLRELTALQPIKRESTNISKLGAKAEPTEESS